MCWSKLHRFFSTFSFCVFRSRCLLKVNIMFIPMKHSLLQVASGSSFTAQMKPPGVNEHVESWHVSGPAKRKVYAEQVEVPKRKVIRRGHRKSLEGTEDELHHVSVPVMQIACPNSLRGMWPPQMLQVKEEFNRDVGSANSSPYPAKSRVSPSLKSARWDQGEDAKPPRGSSGVLIRHGVRKVAVSVVQEESDFDTEEEDEDDTPPSKAPEEPSALVRSKRGRAQALPSRFKDSVVEPLKKGGPKVAKRQPHEVEIKEGTMFLLPNTKKRTKHESNGAGYHKRARKSFYEPETFCSEALDCYTFGDSGDTKESPSRSFHCAGDLDGLDVEGKGLQGISSPDVYKLEGFDMGEIVWAKSGKRNDPFWPARVIDPFREAPPMVRELSLPNRLCVMFYGPSSCKGKNSRVRVTKPITS